MPHILTIDTPGRTLINITGDVEKLLSHSASRCGLANLFLQHTSASLIIQENADPDVQRDLISYFDRIAPEAGQYLHSAEGPDDMPAHIKTALTATTLSIPFAENKLMLGRWQGIYLFEHRRAPHQRRVIVSFISQ